MEHLERADKAALLWLNGWVGHFSALDWAVQFLGSDYLVPVAMALTLLALWFHGRSTLLRERNQRGVLNALLALGFAAMAVEIMNNFLYRQRPFWDLDVSLLFYRPVDSSFPSNPAAVGFALATAVLLYNRKAGAGLVALATAFALSRVYAGVCYPSDVLGGAAIGAAAALLTGWVLRGIEPLPTLVLRMARALYLA